MAVAVSRVGEAGDNERVVHAHTGRAQNLVHGIDLMNDGEFIGGTSKGPGRDREDGCISIEVRKEGKTGPSTDIIDQGLKHSLLTELIEEYYNWRFFFYPLLTLRIQ